MGIISLIERVKHKIFKPRLNDLQYKTDKNPEDNTTLPSIGEGGLDIKFSEVDEQGIIAGERGVLNRKVEDLEPENSRLTEHEKAKEYAIFDCTDMKANFTVTGVRNGNIHLISKDEIGTTNNVKILDVFGSTGSPKVNGIVIRIPTKNTEQKTIYTLAGYIDLTGYIGVNAGAVMALEDILRENLQRIRNGDRLIPEEIQSQVA